MMDKEKFGTDPGAPQPTRLGESPEATDEPIDAAGNIVTGAFEDTDQPTRSKARRAMAMATAVAGAVVAVWAWRRRRRPQTRTERLGHAIEDVAHRTLDQAGKAAKTTRRQGRKTLKSGRGQAKKALKAAHKTDLKAVTDKARSNIPGLH